MTTRTLPAREPDGWWTTHPRYRRYVLFAGTGLVLALVNIVLLVGVAALGSGVEAWRTYLAVLGSIPGLIVMLLLFVGTAFFAVRWMRVGAKLASVKLGPVPAPNTTLVLVLQMGGLVTLFVVILFVLSGALGV